MRHYETIQVYESISLTDCFYCKNFEEYWNNEKFSDVQLKVEDKVLYAHKIVLASKSPFFSAMFKHNMLENIENVVCIKDVSHNVLKEVIRFMYSGRIENLDNLAFDLLTAAEQFVLLDLKKMCESNLCKKISFNNVIEMLKVADLYKANNLKKNSMQFIIDNFPKIVKMPQFKSFAKLNATVIIEFMQALALSN